MCVSPVSITIVSWCPRIGGRPGAPSAQRGAGEVEPSAEEVQPERLPIWARRGQELGKLRALLCCALAGFSPMAAPNRCNVKKRQSSIDASKCNEEPSVLQTSTMHPCAEAVNKLDRAVRDVETRTRHRARLEVEDTAQPVPVPVLATSGTEENFYVSGRLPGSNKLPANDVAFPVLHNS